MRVFPTCLCILAVLGTAACRQREEATVPVEAASARLHAQALRAAWGPSANPTIPTQPEQELSDTDRIDQDRSQQAGGQIIRNSRLVEVGQGRWALISEGVSADPRISAGSLSIHYLRRTEGGFERLAAWPQIVTGGTRGLPPNWAVRQDLTPFAVIVAESGTTAQGRSCNRGELIELTPDRPVVRVNQLKMYFEDFGAPGGTTASFSGRLVPDQVGHSFRIDYEGSQPDVTYVLQGETYKPVDPPDLPWC